jgi:hypothetical protein
LRASDNPFASLLVVEGSAPGSPSAGDQRLFIDSADHVLKLKDSSGTVTPVGSGGGGSISWTTVTSFANSWLDYGNASFYAVSYGKDSLGWVHLRGLLKSGTVGSAAFTLPSGFRPLKNVSFEVNSNESRGEVYVNSDGTVVPQVGSNVYFFLNACYFQADGS